MAIVLVGAPWASLSLGAAEPAARTKVTQNGSGGSAAAFRCSGTVIDAAGQPIPGAVVELYQAPTTSLSRAGMWELKQALTADRAGAFELALARLNTLLLARRPGLAPAWKLWAPTRDTEVKLVLAPPDTLGGVVVDEAGAPVTNAEVFITTAYCELRLESGTRTMAFISGRPARVCFSTHTGAGGRFRLEGVPTNSAADLMAWAPGKILREPEGGSGAAPRRYHTGQQELKLVLEPGASVAGQVVDQETGKPLGNAQLTLTADPPGRNDTWREPVLSDTNGAFQLGELAAGNYRVMATFGTNIPGNWVAEPVLLTLGPGEARRDLRVPANRGGGLEVAVVGAEDRQPVAQATVTLLQNAYQTSALTDSNGLAFFRVPPGEYRITVERDGSRLDQPVATAEPGITNRFEIEFTAAPKITGQVRDPSGAPVPGLKLTLCPDMRPGLRDLKTDTNGQFAFAWAPLRAESRGSFTLLARDPGRNLVAAHDLEAGTNRVELRLGPGVVLAGRVVDPEGAPIPSAAVQIHLLVDNRGFPIEAKTLRTDTDGRFEVSALPPDRRYGLLVSARGFGPLTQYCRPEAGAAPRLELEPIKLKRADRRLAGRVLDADEQPVANALVRLAGEGQPVSSARTDDQGRFSFTQICEGQVQLLANRQGATASAQAAAGETNVLLNLRVAARPGRNAAEPAPALAGGPLPDLEPLGLGADAVPAGKRLLVCLFDSDQRPSRRLVKLLAEQHAALRDQGVAVVGVQAATTPGDAFKEWLAANPLPFPVGRVGEASTGTRWVTAVESLPWLILTDGQKRVVAEGFAVEELEAKLKGTPGQKE